MIENNVNSFESASDNYGFYAMTEHYLGQKFRTIFGIRGEIAKMYYSGQDQRGNVLDNEQTLNELDWLPDETFESGIRKTVVWYLENTQWWQRVLSGDYQLGRLGNEEVK